MTEWPHIDSIPTDLCPPAMTAGMPSPGQRVRQVRPEYRHAEVHQSLYLPVDWHTGCSFPVIVEYAGNHYNDGYTGKVEDCCLGYGLSGGKGFIWACLPYISNDHQRNQMTWWGDVAATVEYCKKTVPDICREYGGNPDAVILAGFSRGAIACNYLGLHDDEIASLWCAFVAHSHYDGVKTDWGYPSADRDSAHRRFQRLKNRPQFISSEGSGIGEIRQYLEGLTEFQTQQSSFTLMPLPYVDHTDTWVLRDIPERQRVREWLKKAILAK